MESSVVRRSKRMLDRGGILVQMVNKSVPVHKFIKEGDVILGMDGVKVSNDRLVPLRRGQQIDCCNVPTQKFCGGFCDVEILRHGEHFDGAYELRSRAEGTLVSEKEKGDMPEYLIIAGFVFMTLSTPFIRSRPRCGFYDSCRKLRK